ncbi:MAG: flagellar export protein FliJ [Rhodothermales bacterium]|nr:flagellar export protein FliJ [Rhodothermales bacterium]
MPGKTFRFSLQSVLDLRRHEAERAEQALTQAVQARRAHEATVADAQARLDGLYAALYATALGPVALRRRTSHLNAARCALRDAEQGLEVAQRCEDDARRTLFEARRHLEALVTLRQGEADRHRQAHAAAEAAFLDEQAVIGYSRNRLAAHG